MDEIKRFREFLKNKFLDKLNRIYNINKKVIFIYKHFNLKNYRNLLTFSGIPKFFIDKEVDKVKGLYL